ncbi:MAG: hypothetical protein LBQ83_01860 [Candidatus Margulisbacteria bacterium]|jgi:hypothetical protein|nr:hypothetical protein [Candidatus Margulisiibacteriota bacterium]
MEVTAEILSSLENSKFNADNDFGALEAALDLLLKQGQAVWDKGSKERELWLELLSGAKALSREAWQKSPGLTAIVCFMQGCLLLSLSLLNGIGRSPLAVKKAPGGYTVKILSKLQTIKLQSGLFDPETEKLLREFKLSFFGKALKPEFGKNDLALIKGAFAETVLRLKREQAFMERIAEDPLQIFKDNIAGDVFGNGVFLIISALPAETMNALLLNIGSFLPGELEEVNEDHFSVNVRAYLTTSTQDLHELFKKTRLLLKLYLGRQNEVLAIIIKDKLQDFFCQLLADGFVQKQINTHLRDTAREQCGLRIKVLDGLAKLL